jgi:ribonuclease I
MKRFFTFILIVLSLSSITEGNLCFKLERTDFSVLSLTWLPKFCDQEPTICVSDMYHNWVANGGNYFTIHGYWPGGKGY